MSGTQTGREPVLWNPLYVGRPYGRAGALRGVRRGASAGNVGLPFVWAEDGNVEGRGGEGGEREREPAGGELSAVRAAAAARADVRGAALAVPELRCSVLNR